MATKQGSKLEDETHISPRFPVIQDLVFRKLLILFVVKIDVNSSDIGTKALGREWFRSDVSYIRIGQ